MDQVIVLAGDYLTCSAFGNQDERSGAAAFGLLTLFVYVGAALAEIGGCYAFWAWMRLGKSALWLIPGLLSLALFATLLTLAEAGSAGRVYAAYGGVYISASLGWLWLMEGVRPDRWDLAGAAICLVGAGVILLGPRPI